MNLTTLPWDCLLPATVNTHPCFFTHGGWRGMTYRHEPGAFNTQTRVALCNCDEHWLPCRSGGFINGVLAIPANVNSSNDRVVDDCRVFGFNGELMYHVTNRDEIGIGALNHPHRFNWLKIADASGPEKNWQFFEQGGELYGIRWVVPHMIYRVKLDYDNGHTCELAHTDERIWPWPFGKIHGGTTPVRYGNLFISFFHSFTIGFPPRTGPAEAMEKTDCNQWKVYFAAPYAFRAQPPFDICLVPTEPMLWPRLQTAGRRSLNGEYTVFPTGLLRDGDSWMLGYGDDRDCLKCEFTTDELFSFLKPI